MRFIITDPKPVSVIIVEKALKSKNANYHFSNVKIESREYADLLFKNLPIGRLEIHRPLEILFENEIRDFLKKVEETDPAAIEKLKGVPGPQTDKDTVLSNLKKAKSMIVLRVLFKDEDPETTLKRIDPLWEWCFKTYKGLLQADGEGFYGNTHGLLLRIK